jgi:phosphate transport system substrate-binding protein
VIRKRSLRLALLLAAVALLLSLAAANASAAFTGAGSTIAGAVMPNWTNGFLIKEGVAVTYSRSTPEAALAKLNARQLDFAAVDAPLTPEQAAACNNCVQIPWLMTGVDLTFKLSGVKKLNLSGKVLAAIYSGKITKWNDPKIAALNPKVKLPGTKITPVYPSEFSGASYGFTSLLSKVSPAWNKSVGAVAAIHYPVGTAAAGDAGVGAAVNATNGAVGYVSAAYASAAGLRVAKIENAAGEFVAPSAESLTAAGNSVTKISPSGIVNATYPPSSATGAYPLAIFGYAVIPHAAPQKPLDQPFLNYVLGPGQKLGEAFDIVPMPKAVKAAAREMVAAL